MAGRFSESFIDTLLERTDLVELVGRYLSLRKSGQEYAACCPFHQEKTPSFHVSPKKQFYHCFGCGAHGTAIGFLMQHEHLSFTDAVEQLATWAGLEIPRETATGSAQDAAAPLLAAVEAAEQFYRQALRNSPAAIDYLRRRGIRGETARDFGLGWAPPGTDRLLHALHPQFSTETLVAAGLVLRREDGRLRDRFHARVLFPIRNRRGQPTGFGGRLIEAGEPKYLNSGESLIFQKSRSLFGLFEARRASTRLEELVITEGYMDVVALAEAGFPQAVACMGTALTTEQLELLFRQVTRLVLCFDGDNAGRRAAWRALKSLLPMQQGQRQMRILFLPEGEDPDSYVRQAGLDAWLQQLERAEPLSRILLQLLEQQHPLDSAEGRSRFAHAALPLLATMTDPLYRSQCTEMIAQHAQHVPEQLHELVQTAVQTALRTVSDRQAPGSSPPQGRYRTLSTAATLPEQTPATASPDRIAATASSDRTAGDAFPGQLWSALLSRVLQFPEWDWQAPEMDRLLETNSSGVSVLQALLRHTRQQPPPTTAQLLERFRAEPYFTRLAALAQTPLPETEPAVSQRIALDSARQLFLEECRRRLRILTQQTPPLSPDEISELRRLQDNLRDLLRT
jgi:DNA primase